MEREHTIKNISRVKESDIESVEQTFKQQGSAPGDYFRYSSPALHSYISAQLEKLAPQNPAKKEQILYFVSNLFKITESTKDREVAEELMQIPGETEPPIDY